MAGKFKMPSIQDVATEEINKTKEKFKVGAGLLSESSKETVMMKITNIPRGEIEKNPENKYSITGIPSLAESIKQYGLVEPLHVAEKENGVYRLLGGERRLTAIDMLIADERVTEWTEDTLIPCVVKGIQEVKLDLSPENKERYAIITTNKEQREYSDSDTYMEIIEWKKIIEELREKGIEYIDGRGEDGKENPITIKGAKTRDILSKTTGISRGQINKFETVDKNGSEKLKNALLDGKLSIAAASKAVKELSEEEQDAVAEAVEKGEDITGTEIVNRSKKTYKITPEKFQEDIQRVVTVLDKKGIVLDGNAQEKYFSYIRQLENLLKGK